MLSFVMVLALAAAGADGRPCDGRLSASMDAYEADETFDAFDAAVAEAIEAEAYAAAETGFADRFEELGLQGSTLGHEQAVASARAGRVMAGAEGLSVSSHIR